MSALLLSLGLLVSSTAPCRADGHNQHRSKAAIRAFTRTHPCPASCATYVKTADGYALHRRCGACQVDHVCPLACCGPDTAANMQWLTDAENSAKSDDCSACKAR